MVNSGSRLLLAVIGTSPLWLSILFFIYAPDNGIKENPLVPNEPVVRKTRNMADMNKASFWNKADMTLQEISPELKENAKNIQIQESEVKVLDATVFYREAKTVRDSNVSVLLLHGMRFSSKTWLELGTINLLAAMGYRVVAVDIPGYGNSPEYKVSDRGEFLQEMIRALKLTRPVIVSPSMSGYFALPYLLSHWKDMGGYIPVAPVGWEVLEGYKKCNSDNPESFKNVPQPLKEFLTPPIPDLSCIQVPSLVVYGELDRTRSSALLCLLPFSQAAEIPKGAHPAYLTDPDLWHKLLYNFMTYTDAYAKQKSN